MVPSNHQLLTDLLTAGLKPELVARVAEACAEAYARGLLDAQPQKSKAAERQDRYRERKRNAVTPEHNEPSQSVTERNKASQCNAFLSPTPPILKSNSNKTSMRDKRGSRIDPNWTPNERNVSDAKAEGLSDFHIAKEARRFVDYWLSKSGSAGVKLDWDAVWRNWCRTFADRNNLQRPISGPTKEAAQSVFVPADTEAFKAWDAHAGKKHPVVKGGWYFPSEYPPGFKHEAA